MGKAFFTGWPLWGKMCFVLLCGIITVIVLGIMKVAYLHWKLRKYTKIAETENARKREMEHRASIKAKRAQEVKIPFGVRAIESGIEVDGVWISRSNTPDTVRQASPSSSMYNVSKARSSSDRLSTDNVPKLEMPQPTRGRARPDVPKDHNLNQDRTSVSPEAGSRGRPAYQPKRSSGLRYSDSQDAVDMATLSSYQHNHPSTTYHTSSDKTPPTDSSNSSDHSSSSISRDDPVINVDDQRQSAADILFDPAYLPPGRPRAQRIPRPTGLDSLPSSRRLDSSSEASHLLPNTRLSEVGMDWTPTQPDMDATSHILQRQFSWEHEPDPELLSDPFKTPIGSPIRGSMAENNNQQYANFYQPAEISTSPVPERRIEHLGDEALPSTTSVPQSTPQQAEPADDNKRSSQVVRKVNSGFEILRPGTLDHPRQPPQRSSMDVADAQWDEEAGQKRHSRKLRRKRASTGRSSIFKEQI